ncbi:hypothetical protein A1507_11800 [Methylomonas koyamae]|uniref:PRTRC system protein E n=1 Tax=Methylomonas koyamae TaxID=702114 RepID=A0A177NDU8_9GAMM|nr:PRTRC system protein E [Methylomonas koyamae]OAI16236.1 hypothetical protein A1507_11800 [Methylomonas koyamae]
MFAQFEEILGDGESIDFSICRQGNRLTVLIQPCFNGSDPGSDDPQLAQVRAILSMPLCVTDTAANLDQDFPTCLTQYVGSVSDGKSAFAQAVSRIREAAKAADSLATATTADEKTAQTPENAEDNDTAPGGANLPTDSKSLF